jgi:uncharacterized protein YkwD
VYGHVERNDETTGRSVDRRRRARPLLPAAAALGLTVAALLTAFGLGVAVLPDSVTGQGVAAEVAPRAELLGEVPPGPADGTIADPAAEPASAAPAPGAPSAEAPSPAAPSPAAPSAQASAKPGAATPAPGKTGRPKSRTSTARPEPAGSDQASQENEVIRLANVERGKAGCGSLELNTSLRTAMRLHVQELGRHGDLYISHVSDDGRSFVDRARAQGYNDPGGENVARGQRNAADVMQSWMNSEGHRANILNCSFKAIGVGVTRGVDGTLVWGQIFGRS